MFKKYILVISDYTLEMIKLNKYKDITRFTLLAFRLKGLPGIHSIPVHRLIRQSLFSEALTGSLKNYEKLENHSPQTRL